MSYEVMKGQAGDRLIIRWKPAGQSITLTSHYGSMEEFFRATEQRDGYDWFEVNGGIRQYPETGKVQ